MAVIETWLKQDLMELVKVTPLKGNIFNKDNQGNLIGVRVYKNGTPEPLSGTVSGFVVKANGVTEIVPSSMCGLQNGEEGVRNCAFVKLPLQCYDITGQISIVIKLTTGTVTTTLGACVGYVYLSTTDNEVVPPGTHIPSLAELEDVVNRAQGIENVNIAQTKTDDILKFTVTDRNGNQTTTVVREPTAKVTKETGGPYVLTVRDGQGTKEDPEGYKYGETVATIPDVAAEVVDKAYVEAVTDPRVALGNPIRVDDAVKAPLDKMTIKLEPKQDLHGYDKPWVGGAGKNLAYINQDTPFTKTGITFTPYEDGSFTLDGTREANGMLFTNIFTGYTGTDAAQSDKVKHIKNGTYYLRVWKNGAVNTTLSLQFYGANSDTNVSIGSSTTNNGKVVIDDTYPYNYVRIYISAGTYSDSDVYRIQICSEADTYETWAPYENICPISSYDAVNVTRAGKNFLRYPYDNTTRVSSGITFTDNGDGSITIDGESTAIAGFYLFADTNPLPVPNGRYILGFEQDGSLSANDIYLHSKVHDTDSYTNSYTRFEYVVDDGKFSAVQIRIPTGKTISNVTIRPYIISANESDFSYEIGQNETYPVSLSVAGDTVYGGELTLNRDGSGTVTVDRTKRYVEDLGDSAFTSATSSNGVTYFWLYLQTIKAYGNVTISDFLKDAGAISGAPNVGYFRTSSDYKNSIQCAMPSSLVGTTLDSVRTYFRTNKNHTDNYFVGIMSTTVSYPLTAAQVQMLNGINHLSIDAQGKTEIIYRTDKYASVESGYSALPQSSASGNPVVIADGADGAKLKKLTMHFEPVQNGEGTPSPSNFRPIESRDKVTIGRAARNLCPVLNADSSTVNGITWTNNRDGSITVSGTATANSYIGNTSVGTPLGVLPTGQYVATARLADGTLSEYVGIRIGQGTSASQNVHINQGQLAYTPDGQSMCYISLRVLKNVTVPANHTVYIQFEYGSEPTEYEPYCGSIFPIRFPSEAGTVYGGEITINRDGSGTLTVDTAMIKLGAVSSIGSSSTGKYVSWWGFPNVYKNDNELTCVAERLNFVARADRSGAEWEANIVNPGTFSAYVPSDATVESVNAALEGSAVVYKLANPVTYQLTAPQVTTLLGYNVIYGDGEMDIEYYADPKMYIDGAVPTDVSRAIAETERGTVATANHPVGDVFILNGRLCEATSAIAIGETLVPYTNYRYTSVENHFAPRKTPQFTGSISISDGAGDVSLSRSKLQELVWIAGLVGNGTITETGDITSYPTTLQPYGSASLGWVAITLPDNAIAPADLSMDSSLFSVSGRATGVSVNGAFHYSCSFSRNRKTVNATLTVTNDTNRVLNVTISPSAKISVTLNYKTFN